MVRQWPTRGSHGDKAAQLPFSQVAQKSGMIYTLFLGAYVLYPTLIYPALTWPMFCLGECNSLSVRDGCHVARQEVDFGKQGVAGCLRSM